MKSAVIFVSLIFSISSFAQSAKINECSSKVFNVDDWSAFSEGVLTCFDASSDFVDGIDYLCAKHRTQVSVSFREYLKYKKNYEDAVAVLQAIPLNQPRAVAQMKVQQASEDWSILGKRSQVSVHLNKVNSSAFVCKEKQ